MFSYEMTSNIFPAFFLCPTKPKVVYFTKTSRIFANIPFNLYLRLAGKYCPDNYRSDSFVRETVYVCDGDHERDTEIRTKSISDDVVENQKINSENVFISIKSSLCRCFSFLHKRNGRITTLSSHKRHV